MKRLALTALALCMPALAEAASPEQIGGWTVESFQNPSEKLDFTVRVKKTVGNATVAYNIGTITSEGVFAKIGDCSSSSQFSLYDDEGKPKPRGAAVKAGMNEFLAGLGDSCSVSASNRTQLLAGLEQALAVADKRFATGRPKPDLTPKTAGAGGWSFRDAPTLGPDGLITYRTLSMSRMTNGLKLTYEIAMSVNGYSSTPEKTMKGSLKDCSYEDSDQSEFLDIGRRAKDVREKIKTNLPSYMMGCEVGDGDVAAALIGFEAAYAMLDKWMIDRADERLILVRAANDYANSDEFGL